MKENYDFEIPKKYKETEYNLLKSVEADDKTLNFYTNDKKEIIFKNGVKKEIFNDNHQIIYFANGDIKQIYPDGKSVYYFKDEKTVKTTMNDGLQIFKLDSGEIEIRCLDGIKLIKNIDGKWQKIEKDGKISEINENINV